MLYIKERMFVILNVFKRTNLRIKQENISQKRK